jgi:hypothetical protein
MAGERITSASRTRFSSDVQTSSRNNKLDADGASDESKLSGSCFCDSRSASNGSKVREQFTTMHKPTILSARYNKALQDHFNPETSFPSSQKLIELPRQTTVWYERWPHRIWSFLATKIPKRRRKVLVRTRYAFPKYFKWLYCRKREQMSCPGCKCIKNRSRTPP